MLTPIFVHIYLHPIKYYNYIYLIVLKKSGKK